MRKIGIYELDVDDIIAACRQFVREIENGSPGPVGKVGEVKLHVEYDADSNDGKLVSATVEVEHDE